jgi:tRNA nucleotidyltransferase (CCA-adding enzyme)
VYTHTAYVVESVGEELALRWAALLHDVGKVAAFTMDENGRGHFHGHAQISAEMADDLLLALKAPTALRRQVTELIRRHMQELPVDKKSMRRQLSKLGQETFEQLLTLQKADFCSKGVDGNLEEFLRAEDLLREILEEVPCLTAKDLAVNGQDMMALGLRGKDIGTMLEKLLQMVLEEQLPNEKTALLQAAKKEI